MNTTYLLGTNTLIYFLNGALTPEGFSLVLNAFQQKEAAISIISKIELLGFPFPSAVTEEKAEKLVDHITVISLSDEIVNKTIEIRKKQKIKVADAIISATTMLGNYYLISRNERDFKNLHQLNLINSFSL